MEEQDDGAKDERKDSAILPKKPVGGAWGVFMTEKRPEIMEKASSSEERKLNVVTKQVKELWDALGEEGRKPYQEKFANLKKAYDDTVQERRQAAVCGA